MWPSIVSRPVLITSTWPTRAISSRASAGSTRTPAAAGCWSPRESSSTPAITSALIAELAPEFAEIEEIHTALSPGNQNPRGAATIAAVLSYLGRKIRVWHDGQWVERPGWGDVRRLQFPAAGRPPPRSQLRRAGSGAFPGGLRCQDGPLFRRAGAERAQLPALALCAAVPVVRPRLHAPRTFFLNVSLMLFPFGTTNGALAIWVRGRDHAGRPDRAADRAGDRLRRPGHAQLGGGRPWPARS